MNESEKLAFVGGFLEGEGTIGTYPSVDRRRLGKEYKYMRPEIVFKNSNKELLEFCQQVVGGHIYPVKDLKDSGIPKPHWNIKKQYQLIISGKSNAKKIAAELIPYLISNVKRGRALQVLALK